MTQSIAVVKEKSPVPGFAKLVREVREILARGRERVERETVRTHWKVGKRINEDLEGRLKPAQKNAERGKQVVIRLAQKLEISDKVLYRCMRFAEAFPFFATWRKMSEVLTWSHYKILIGVADEKKRLALAEQAGKRGWDSRELGRVVRKMKEKSRASKAPEMVGPEKAGELLVPQKGLLHTYRMLSWRGLTGEEELKVDLGFRVRRRASLFEGAGNLRAGDIVEGVASGDSYALAKTGERTSAELYTYRASVFRVVDGDTLYVEIDLGFGTSIEEYLRLRGIDAPEIDTEGGREAKAFVEKELARAPWITLTSSRSDKYARYLADVYYEVGGKEYYLNNMLLEAGLAEQV